MKHVALTQAAPHSWSFDIIQRHVPWDCIESLPEALELVANERCRQDNKWGGIENFDDRPPEKWMTILMEEVGELAEGVLCRDQENVLEEAAQVAAVATAIVESMQRRAITERPNSG